MPKWLVLNQKLLVNLFLYQVNIQKIYVHYVPKQIKSTTIWFLDFCMFALLNKN